MIPPAWLDESQHDDLGVDLCEINGRLYVCGTERHDGECLSMRYRVSRCQCCDALCDRSWSVVIDGRDVWVCDDCEREPWVLVAEEINEQRERKAA